MSAQLAEPDHLVIQARDVSFDWSAVPLHWIPDQPVATHFINVLHLLLPAGEEWFVKIFKDALPYITDDRVREDVLGFIGQEAVHASSHDEVLDHFRELGLDTRPFVRQVEFIFGSLMGDRDHLTGDRARGWLFERIGIIAAIEHFTHLLGQWILDAKALDEAGADPMMMDLLRWHGAEEVEHRHVAHDLFMHLDGRYTARVRAFGQVIAMLMTLWHRGHVFLLDNDPIVGGQYKGGLHHFKTLGPKGLLPTFGEMGGSIRRYLKPGYSPATEGDTAQALAYLASSPAAQAALR